MHVDKFERNGERATSGINIANLANSIQRRGGGNTAIWTIDMNSHNIKNVADPLSNQDFASNNYVHTNAGGNISCHIQLNVGSHLVRHLGCNDRSADQKFTLLLWSDTNMLSYSVPNLGLPMHIKM